MQKDDMISRQAALALAKDLCVPTKDGTLYRHRCIDPDAIRELPSVEPTLYGYSIEHLAFIAHVLQREDIPPEKIMDLFTDIGRVVKMITDEYAVTIRKAMEQWMT